jgi:toxin ParE1/3/4
MGQPQLLFAPEAERDLDEIWFEIASKANAERADRFLAGLRRACEPLAQFPEMGRLRPELAPELRSLVHGRYVIFYRPVAGGAEVARVLHGARDLPAIFGTEEE